MLKRKRLACVGGAVILAIVAFAGWYSIAANYDYGALAGTYIFNRDGERCTLSLRSDRTFSEELNRSGNVQVAQGQWHRSGEAHVSFSPEFLRVSGQELDASGQAHGQFDKALGLHPYLTLAPLPGGPIFRKKWLH